MREMRGRTNGTMAILGAAVLAILLGLFLLLFPGARIIQIVYGIGVVMIVGGIVSIVRYFMTESYRKLNCYTFSAGALMVVLGVCALLRAEIVSTYLLVCLGILLLASGIIKLQHALDLEAMKDKAWIAILVVAVTMIICGAVVLLNPFDRMEDLSRFTYIMLVIDGCLSLFSVLYLTIRLHGYQKQAKDMAAYPGEVITDIVSKDAKDSETGNDILE
ncbi:MAG: DUF308 domain-containing protein [Lachnospiraceae bacterium]|nr:DUF308 domain-containing protein [Lachnospiraceae bacterium]